MKKRFIVLFILALFILPACTIKKYKDLSSYPNLLLGTNNGIQNFTTVDKGYDSVLEDEGDGVKVTANSYDDEGWLVLLYDDHHSREILAGPKGELYTIVFEAKSNLKGAEIQASHRKANAEDCQIVFGTAMIEKPDIWRQYVLTGALLGVEPTSQYVYFDLRHNPAGTEISIRNLKLVKGGF